MTKFLKGKAKESEINKQTFQMINIIKKEMCCNIVAGILDNALTLQEASKISK